MSLRSSAPGPTSILRGGIAFAAVLLVSAAMAACSSAPAPADTSPILNGSYRFQGEDGGAPSPTGILEVAFFQASYSMFVACDGDPVTGCFDYGTYDIATDSQSLTFHSELGAADRTIPFALGEAQTLQPDGLEEDEALHTDDLVTGGSTIVGASSAPLVKSGVPVVTNFSSASGSKFGLVCTGDGSGTGSPPAGSTATQSVSPPGIGFDVGRYVLADGHVLNNGSDYDIWSKNCHTAANFELVHNTKGQWGIISCKGSLAQNTQQGHTFNYVVTAGKATFWNWSMACVADDKMYTPPPDISSGKALACVQMACGNQYTSSGSQSMQTTALPPGQMVEQPGPANCVAQAGSATKSQQTFDTCNSCCNSYANFWTVNQTAGMGQSLVMKNSYLTQCLANCTSKFGMGSPTSTQ